MQFFNNFEHLITIKYLFWRDFYKYLLVSIKDAPCWTMNLWNATML